MFGQGS